MTQDTRPQPRPFRIGDKVLIVRPEPQRAGSIGYIDLATGEIHVRVENETAYTRVSPEDLELDRRPKPRPRRYDVGQIVRIIDGPFAGWSGVVDAVFPDRLRVSAMVFGRATLTEVSYSQVEKA